jgi:hypothetical protein
MVSDTSPDAPRRPPGGDRRGPRDGARRPGGRTGEVQAEAFLSADRRTKPPAISSRPMTMNQMPSRVARALTEFEGTVTTTMPAARLTKPKAMTQPR